MHDRIRNILAKHRKRSTTGIQGPWYTATGRKVTDPAAHWAKVGRRDRIRTGNRGG